MKCPHCGVGIREDFEVRPACNTSAGQTWHIENQVCPECKLPIIRLRASQYRNDDGYLLLGIDRFLAYPRNASARPLPSEVPDPYRQDFDEAVAVLPISPKASAALSRRNLQAIIHDKAGIKKKDLNLEIQALIDSGSAPPYVTEGLDAVRHIGNFAAHPIKSTSTGEVVEVEPGEAEWNLDVLETLFDFYFVQPANLAAKKAALNQKLADAGKPLLK